MAGDTRDATTIGDYLFNLVDENAADWGIAKVFLGDQRLLPATPAACVLVGQTSRTLVGVPRYVEATFTVYLLVYHAALKDSQVTERECNQRAEAIAGGIDPDATLGGLVIHGFVQSIEPGYATLSESNWYRTSRITWQGISRFLLGGTS